MKKTLLGLFALVVSVTLALGAGYFPGWPIVGEGSYCASFVNGACQGPIVPAGPSGLTGNELIPADTENAQGIQPETVLVPPNVLAGGFANPRNVLGNSDLLGTQVNGTNTVTCATTSSPATTALSADRVVCDVNVASGAGRSAVVTSTPSPPTGFQQSLKLYRTSGSLAQPVCAWMAVPTSISTQLAGQTVTFSAYVAALAGLAADNGGIANLVIIAGSGTDQGLNGSWTASPAITPAWTNITTVVTTPIVLSTSFARFFTTAAIPATVGSAATTEVGVAICFTPTTGASGGSTDGIAFVGQQLERGPAMSAYEVRSKASEILDNEQYIYAINETATDTARATGVASTTSLAKFTLNFPVPMYKAPTMGYTTGFAACSSTACSALTACTSLATDSVFTGIATNTVGIACGSSAGFAAAGSATIFSDDDGSGQITAWTGF